MPPHRSAVLADVASLSYDERVLLVAPTRRDAEVTCRALSAAGVACTVCPSLADLVSHIDGGVGALMLTDRILADPDLQALLVALDRQPSWSSLPIVFLAQDRERAPSVRRGLDGLRNVTVLDRPASMRSVISAVEASLRGRRWQYQIRDQWVAQGQAEAQLRQADQRKDEFLATLAHELRIPLAALATGLQVLKRSIAPLQAQSSVLDMMERQLGRLVKLRSTSWARCLANHHRQGGAATRAHRNVIGHRAGRRSVPAGAERREPHAERGLAAPSPLCVWRRLALVAGARQRAAQCDQVHPERGVHPPSACCRQGRKLS